MDFFIPHCSPCTSQTALNRTTESEGTKYESDSRNGRKENKLPETAPIAATAEHNANFEENIRAIIRSGKPASVIRDDLDNYHANDIAEVLETLDTATRETPLQYSLSGKMTAEIFTYLDEPAPYLHELGLDRAAAVLAEMDADEDGRYPRKFRSGGKEALIARMDSGI